MVTLSGREPMSSLPKVSMRTIQEVAKRMLEGGESFSQAALERTWSANPGLFDILVGIVNPTAKRQLSTMFALCHEVLTLAAEEDGMRSEWPGGFKAGEVVIAEGRQASVTAVPVMAEKTTNTPLVPVVFVDNLNHIKWFEPEMLGSTQRG